MLRARPTRRRLLLALACALPSAAAAAAPDGGDLPLRGFVRRIWTSADGLPQSSVTALAQTPDGYLWIGTLGGLARFDGDRFLSFDPASEPPLPNGRVLALAVDRAGTLWIGSESAGLLRRIEGRFVRQPLDLPRPFQIRALAAAADGGLWIGTNRGLVHLAGSRVSRFGLESGLPSLAVNALAESGAGELWAATESGLARLESGSFRGYGARVPVSALDVAPDGAILALDERGRRIEVPGAPAPGPLPADELGTLRPTRLRFARDGSLWITGAGIARLAAGHLRVAPIEAGLVPGVVRSLLEDSEGNLWLGTDGQGLVRLHRGAVVTLGRNEGLGAESVLPVLEDRDGVVWVGGNCGGLWRSTRGGFEETFRRGGRSFGCVRALLEDRAGRLWIGHDAGLDQLPARRGSLAVAEPEAVPVGPVRALFEQRDGTLWAATASDLLRRGPGAEELRPAEPALDPSLAPARAFFETSDGTLWLGLEEGVAERTATGWRRHGGAEGLPDVPVRDFHEEGPGRLWAATYGGGLARYDGRRWRTIGRTQGLPDVFLSRLLPDRSGQVWVTGNRGLFRVGFDDLAAVESGRRAGLSPLEVRAEDGLLSAEFNGGGTPAGWRARDGRIWLPMLRGLAVLDPAALERSLPRLPTLIEEVYIDGRRRRSVPARIELPAGAEELEIQFTAVAFRAPRIVRFRYQLEGYDRDWRDAGGQRRAAYRRVAPGSYTFRAAATRGLEAWGEEARLEVTFLPLLHQRTGVRVTAGVVATALAAGILAWRSRRLRVQRARLEAVIAERTAELSAAKRRSEDQVQVLARQEVELAGLARGLEARVAEQTVQLRQTRDLAIYTLARIAELRDGITGKHLERIAAYSRRLAEALAARQGVALDPEFVDQIFRSSPLHDIGKVAIPDAILQKPGPLTDEERRIMESHTSVGGDTLRQIIERYERPDFLAMGMDIAYSHHERWDGNGYPNGLAGEEIPLAARVVAVVDAYDAITSVRPYKPALQHELAVARIVRDRGTHFDPELIDVFLACAGDLPDLRAALADPD